MKEQILKGEENEVRLYCNNKYVRVVIFNMLQLRKKIVEKSKDGSLKVTNGEAKTAPKKRGRWDQTVEESPVPSKKKTLSITSNSTATTPIWDNDVKYLFVLFSLIINFGHVFIEDTGRSPLG